MPWDKHPSRLDYLECQGNLLAFVLNEFEKPMFKSIIISTKSSKLKQPDLSCLPDRFIFLDLETTGLDANAHEVIEVAAIKYVKGESEQTSFQSLVKPEKRIPAKITQITGIDKEMIASEGRDPKEVWPDFFAFIYDLPLVSYNYAFDGPFLQAALKKYAGAPLLKNPSSCALVLARRAWPGLESYKLGALAKRAKLDAGDAHRALSDAKTGLILYCHAASKLGRWR
jgi:DNA polymerase III epsilon subunit family exonuclease